METAAREEQQARIHRALGWPTRARVLRLIREADAPPDAHELADRTGLHPNTVRSHLERLEQAGLVASHPRHTGRRGRPRIVFEAVALAGGLDADDAVDSLLTLTAECGYEPELDEETGHVLLHRCPFEAAAHANPAVCSAHFALLRQVLAGLGDEVRAVGFEAHPGRPPCVVRLSRA